MHLLHFGSGTKRPANGDGPSDSPFVHHARLLETACPSAVPMLNDIMLVALTHEGQAPKALRHDNELLPALALCWSGLTKDEQFALAYFVAQLGDSERAYRSLATIAQKRLSPEERARFGAELLRHVVTSYQCLPTAADAEQVQGRLATIAERFPHLTTEQQQDVAALVLSVNNGPADTDKRAAFRNLLKRALTPAEWAYYAGQMLKWLSDAITKDGDK